jgi:hypothetical protein
MKQLYAIEDPTNPADVKLAIGMRTVSLPNFPTAEPLYLLIYGHVAV